MGSKNCRCVRPLEEEHQRFQMCCQISEYCSGEAVVVILLHFPHPGLGLILPPDVTEIKN